MRRTPQTDAWHSASGAATLVAALTAHLLAALAAPIDAIEKAGPLKHAQTLGLT